ncbi:MAG: MmgE/PrpD family protein [Halocynthiibacter sp.]
MTHHENALRFLFETQFEDLPTSVQDQMLLNILDLVGNGIGGTTFEASNIIRAVTQRQYGGPHPMIHDGRLASAAGVALAYGTSIDALDGHDGFNPAKGHIGCAVLAGVLATALETGLTDGQAFLTAIAIGYEFGARLAIALHDSAPDYHTSGAWAAIAVAALSSRMMGLSHQQTRHAMGIAEYNGPRSQMMRCIDHPTMVKDGSGWGAMVGVMAAQMAQDGFTGAPALTFEKELTPWADLGERWYGLEQYYKPYPVCRWAQAPIEAILDLKRRHDLRSQDVKSLRVDTFHESVRLATTTPQKTDEAQYSTSFPCAVALVKGDVRAQDIADGALNDPEIMRLSQAMDMHEHPDANAVFPHIRKARVEVTLYNGSTLTSKWHTPRWDAVTPPTLSQLHEKFDKTVIPLWGNTQTDALKEAIYGLKAGNFADFKRLMTRRA